jgi:hypothetical protein
MAMIWLQLNFALIFPLMISFGLIVFYLFDKMPGLTHLILLGIIFILMKSKLFVDNIYIWGLNDLPKLCILSTGWLSFLILISTWMRCNKFIFWVCHFFFSEFLKENMWLSFLIYSLYIYDCFYFLVVIKFLVD